MQEFLWSLFIKFLISSWICWKRSCHDWNSKRSSLTLPGSSQPYLAGMAFVRSSTHPPKINYSFRLDSTKTKNHKQFLVLIGWKFNNLLLWNNSYNWNFFLQEWFVKTSTEYPHFYTPKSMASTCNSWFRMVAALKIFPKTTGLKMIFNSAVLTKMPPFVLIQQQQKKKKWWPWAIFISDWLKV